MLHHMPLRQDCVKNVLFQPFYAIETKFFDPKNIFRTLTSPLTGGTLSSRVGQKKWRQKRVFSTFSSIETKNFLTKKYFPDPHRGTLCSRVEQKNLASQTCFFNFFLNFMHF